MSTKEICIVSIDITNHQSGMKKGSYKRLGSYFSLISVVHLKNLINKNFQSFHHTTHDIINNFKVITKKIK